MTTATDNLLTRSGRSAGSGSAAGFETAQPPMPANHAGLAVLYVGPMSGTSRHRRDAFARLGHRVAVLEPRRLLPASPWLDRIEWHVSAWLPAKLLERRLAAHLAGQRYDLVFVDGGSLLTRRAVETLRRHADHVVNFNHDDPFGDRDRLRFAPFRAAVPAYDLAVVVRPINVAEAERAGARKVLLHPMVADEIAHAPRPLTSALRARWDADVAFIGSWMPERGPFLLDLIERGVPLAIYGPHWHKAPEWPRLAAHHRADYLDGDDYAHAVQCAKISLGLLSKGNRDQHTTRSMEIPLLGGVLCAERTAEHLALYRDGEEAVFWANAEECAGICLDLLADAPRRAQIAARGRSRCLANGTTSEHLIETAIAALPALR